MILFQLIPMKWLKHLVFNQGKMKLLTKFSFDGAPSENQIH